MLTPLGVKCVGRLCVTLNSYGVRPVSPPVTINIELLTEFRRQNSCSVQSRQTEVSRIVKSRSHPRQVEHQC
jgi:hypothetical protein